MIDIVEVKTLINKGDLEVSVVNGNILLKNKRNGEAVKIGSAAGIKTFDSEERSEIRYTERFQKPEWL